MSTNIDVNGVQYNANYYNSSVGYKCCTTVEHNIILCHNCTFKDTAIDIPQLDSNCHILMMHLYSNDTLVNLCNVSSIELKFTCGNKVIIGDYRRLSIVNACKGLISYILDKDVTSYIGLNDITVTLTIGTGTVKFDGSYNVVPNVQTETTTIILPNTPRDEEYVYGPSCRHTLCVSDYSYNNTDGDCDCSNCNNYNCPSCPIYPDDADNITLRELYFTTMGHINNKSLHLNNKRIETLNSCFKTVENYADLLNEISCSCSGDKIANGRLYRVNNVNDEVKYYYWDAPSISFKETTFGSQGEPGRDANDITWNELDYGNEVKTTVGGLTAGTDISNLTITQILAKMLGIGKEVPIPTIENVENKTIPIDNTIVLSYPIYNLIDNLVSSIDTTKIELTSDAVFSSNIIFDDVSDNIIVTLSNLTADTVIDIVFNEGVVTQIGNPEFGYEEETKYSEQKSCQIIIV